jgi:hypothetical protein
MKVYNERACISRSNASLEALRITTALLRGRSIKLVDPVFLEEGSCVHLHCRKTRKEIKALLSVRCALYRKLVNGRSDEVGNLTVTQEKPNAISE